ncbi:MAG: 4Fe-4S binding protein [Syntrophaceae bacterium]|nr:4Fe-4S binding protein [Syntrophaceae bacterium]
MNRNGTRSFGRGGDMGRGRGTRRGRGIMGGMTCVSQASRSPAISGNARQPFINKVPGEILPNLKTQARELEEQLRAVNTRIRELEKSGKDIKKVAFIDLERCAGCGICEWVCPNGAISIGKISCIDQSKCTGCGRCIAKCPQSALSLREA